MFGSSALAIFLQSYSILLMVNKMEILKVQRNEPRDSSFSSCWIRRYVFQACLDKKSDIGDQASKDSPIVQYLIFENDYLIFGKARPILY